MARGLYSLFIVAATCGLTASAQSTSTALPAATAASASATAISTAPPVSQSPGVDAPIIATIFQYGAVPASLEASAISTRFDVDLSSVITLIQSYKIDCPTTRSPENDACRALGIYPAIAYRSAGNNYGGTITASAQNATTTWACVFGKERTPAPTGSCYETLVTGGSTVTRTSVVDQCTVLQHYVPLVVTAGVEPLNPIYPPSMANYTVSDFLALWDDQLSAKECPARPTLGAAATITSSTAATTDTAASSSTSAATSSIVTTSGGDRTSLNMFGFWLLAALGQLGVFAGL